MFFFIKLVIAFVDDYMAGEQTVFHQDNFS